MDVLISRMSEREDWASMTAAERMQLEAGLHHRHLHSLISAWRETQLPPPPPTQAPALASAIPTAAINAIADAVAN